MNNQKDIPKISVVCPTLNEGLYIEALLYFLVRALPKEKEVFIIDGGSVDETRNIVQNWSLKYDNIKLVDNPEKYVPHALNKVIPWASGQIIVRLDAHTKYAINYFEKILETFNSVEADIVGGPMRPIGKIPFQKAVAIVTTNSFGLGDSKFHDINYKGYADTVYLGAWKRSIFYNTGLFDESLIRNQDDEFHYRAKSIGYKIYLNPEIKSLYYPRQSFTSLFSQYFQYGLYKPLVLRKVKSETKIRHLVPSLFVCYLISLPFILALNNLLCIPLLIYLLLNLIFSFFNTVKFRIKLICIVVYPTIHIAYGCGFILGIRKYFKFDN